MTREEKLEAIYEEMANKELTFGCKLQVIESVWPIQWVIFNIVSESYKVLWDDRRISTETKNSDLTVIWHPVMIGTIFEQYSASKWFINSQFIIELVDKWTGYDKSIEDQSDECIDYLYSLIKK